MFCRTASISRPLSRLVKTAGCMLVAEFPPSGVHKHQLADAHGFNWKFQIVAHCWCEIIREMNFADDESPYELTARSAVRQHARLIMVAMTICAIVLALSAWLKPAPFVIAGLISWPWLALALVACRAGVFTVYDRRGQHNPIELGLAFALPGLTLTLLAVVYLHVVRWQDSVALTIAFTLLLWFPAMKADAVVRKRRGRIVGLLVVCAPYGYGAGMEVNALLDRSPAMTYSAHVTDKHASHSRGTSAYYLHLEPWGPRVSSDDVPVPYALYTNTQIGDSVCVELKPGLLHVAWYLVKKCLSPGGRPDALKLGSEHSGCPG